MSSLNRVLYSVIFFGFVFPLLFVISFAIIAGLLLGMTGSDGFANFMGFTGGGIISLLASYRGYIKATSTSNTIPKVHLNKENKPLPPVTRSYDDKNTNQKLDQSNSNTGNLTYDLSEAIGILKENRNKKLYEKQNIKINVIDNFLYCGKFNSVLGPEGFKLFKEKLKDIIKDVNNDNFNSNFINLDKMFECLLDSGVYYLEEHTPKELTELNQNDRWLTAFRYISKNFPNIDYKDFREIVKRFKDSKMYSIYIQEKDSPLLRSIGQSELFDEVIDAKAELLHLNQKQQRELCEKLGVQAARSLEETADRIIEHSGDKVLELISQDKKKKRYYKIKDLELATGEDIVQLDSYLRSISKVMREDLTQFIIKQRHGSIAA